MKINETPCPACGERKLRIEIRERLVASEHFSLAGAWPKVSALREDWPWLVCDGCGVETAAKSE